MREGAPLDLSALLPQYADYLPDVPVQAGPVLMEDAPDGRKYPFPTRLGDGPVTWSCSRTLAVRRPVIYDVNGYYRELGVRHDATRRELREAYQAKDGQSSPRLTYVFRQLLDPVVREAYDRSPLGQPFMDDYVEDTVKRRAAREAQRRTHQTGEFTSAEQVLGDWGYVLLDEDGDSEPLDTVASVRQDQVSQANPRAPRWGYASYAWQTTSYLRDEATLVAWQAALTRAAEARGISQPNLAIGTTAMSEVCIMLDEYDNQHVAFFPEGAEPSDEIAGEALDAFHALLDSPTTPQPLTRTEATHD